MTSSLAIFKSTERALASSSILKNKVTMWDLRVESRAGQFLEWENLNLLEISKVTLYYQDGKATARVE
jgi:hypothetical protein